MCVIEERGWGDWKLHVSKDEGTQTGKNLRGGRDVLVNPRINRMDRGVLPTQLTLPCLGKIFNIFPFPVYDSS